MSNRNKYDHLENLSQLFNDMGFIMNVADKHQLKILRDTVKNPMKSLLGDLSAEEAEEMLRTKFRYTDKQIQELKK